MPRVFAGAGRRTGTNAYGTCPGTLRPEPFAATTGYGSRTTRHDSGGSPVSIRRQSGACWTAMLTQSWRKIFSQYCAAWSL